MATVQFERRKEPRFNLHVPFRCWEVKEGKAVEPCIEFTCRNLSIAGLAFQSEVSYEMGTELIAEISIPGRDKPVKAALKVVWCQSNSNERNYTIGTQFKELAKEDIEFVAASLAEMNLNQLLDQAIKQNASDLHLTVGHAPILRVDGTIRAMEGNPIQEGQIKAMMYPLLSKDQIEEFEKTKELDFAFSPDPNCRFRVNLHYQKGFVEAALRTVESKIKNFKELGLPVVEMERICRERSGIFLIAGKTGEGKSTTMSSMVDYINANMKRVIITIEDPIEHIFQAKKCIIKQRELGSDTASFSDALRHATRQDPDVIVVGELRDPDSVLSALRAAETGHLVITTIQATDATQAIESVINLFPSDQSQTISGRLSASLLGVIYQLLIPDKQATLALATELLLNHHDISTMIRTQHYDKIRSALNTGESEGSYALDISLRKLYHDLIIDKSVMENFSKAA